MAKRSAINEGDEPAELNIGLDKIQDIVLRARAFDFKDFPDEPDPGADLGVGEDREERLDQGDDPTEAELRELIDDLNEDEIVDLIALVWIGRGDFGKDDLAAARLLARERHQGPSSSYLMGIPTLGEYLAEGLSTAGSQESPHLSDRSKNVGEERLLLQHLGEALHQRAQPVITHCGQ